MSERPSRFLRFVLRLDAASCALTALAHLLAAPILSERLGMAHGLLVASGLLLVGVIAFAGYLASCDPIPAPLVRLLIAGNWAWVAGCLILVFTGAASTTLGQAYLVLQAVAVAVVAELEWLGLRRSVARGFA